MSDVEMFSRYQNAKQVVLLRIRVPRKKLCFMGTIALLIHLRWVLLADT
jgi:hypothetical protein